MLIGIGIDIPFKLGAVGSGGGGSGYDPASDSIFAGFTTPPTTNRKALIDQVVVALKAAGVWAKLDTLYCFAAADNQAAKVNWIAPGTYNCTEVNSPAFTADVGFTGGSPKYLDTGFNPTTAPGSKYIQDSATALVWSLTPTSLGSNAAVGGFGDITFMCPFDGTYYAVAINNNGWYWLNNNNSGSGLFTTSRTATNTVTGYINSLSRSMGLAGGTAASGPVPNGNFRFMFRYGTSGYWAGQVAWGGFGASLTQADNTALYNALANYMAGLAGTQMVAESVAIFAGMTVPPTVARRQRINDAVVALKAGGVWAKLDAVYAFAAADSQAAKINWVQPGTYNCTEVSAPAFTVDQGFTGNGTSSYLDTNFNISSAAGRKFAQNDAMIAGWSLTNIDVNAGVVGTSLQDTCILPRLTNLAYGYINDLFGNWPNLDGTGFYCLTRRSATAKELYRNGVSIGTSAQSSSAVVNSTLRFLRYSTGHWAGQCAAGAVGSQLSAVEQLALYEALLAYQTGIATDAIAASFVTPPTAARKSLIQTCVGALMRAGVWNKLDVLHMFAAADSQAAKINWVKPGTYNATEVSAPTFVADAGFTGGGAAYLDTNFEINGSPAPKYTLNSALFSVWTNGSYTSVSATLGSAGGLVDGIYPKYTDNHFYGRLTAGAGTSDGGIVASSAGLKTITRTGVGTLAMYDGGTKVSSPTTASTGLPTAGDNVTGYALGGVPCWVIGGGITDAEQLALYNALNAYIASTRIFAAFTTPPTPARQTLIQNAVASLMTAGVWDKLDRLYMFAAADSQAALINWKQPGTGDATLVNAPAFVADRGFTGGSTKYINCNFNSTIGSPNITANSACLFGRALTDVKEVNCMWGNTATNTTGMHPHYTDDTALGRVFQTTANASVACTNAVAFWSTNRSGASAEQMYKDGSQVATVSVASLGLITQYVVLTNAPNLYWTGQIGSHGIGASLNATEQLALYNAERAYMTGVGVP